MATVIDGYRLTQHCVCRWQERFGGSRKWAVAARQIERVLSEARPATPEEAAAIDAAHGEPGRNRNGRYLVSGDVVFVAATPKERGIKADLVTCYRADYLPSPC